MYIGLRRLAVLHLSCTGVARAHIYDGPGRPTGKAAKPVTILFASSGASCLSWQLAEFARVSPASPPPVLASATCRYLWCVAPHIVYYNMRVFTLLRNAGPLRRRGWRERLSDHLLIPEILERFCVKNLCVEVGEIQFRVNVLEFH